MKTSKHIKGTKNSNQQKQATINKSKQQKTKGINTNEDKMEKDTETSKTTYNHL